MSLHQPVSGSGAGGGGGASEVAILLESGAASAKTTALGTMTDPQTTDRLYVVDDPAGVAASEQIEIGRLLAWLGLDVVQGRLTLTTGTPITTSDVTAATTLYFTPFNGNRIALFDGTDWDLYSFSELSIAVPAQASQMYDVFVYDNAGVLTLELTAWTNDTTRATALTTQDGVYVRSGATTRRYLGSFRTTAVAGQTEDSVGARLVWNAYHRVSRPMAVIEATASWNYNVATWRSANASAANRLTFAIGLSEDAVSASVFCRVYVAESTADAAAVGIGLDSTAVNNAQTVCRISIGEAGAANPFVSVGVQAHYIGYPGIGYHYLQWLERSNTGNPAYYGTVSPDIASGILGCYLG